VVRPVYLADIREHLCNTHSGIVVEGHEAEDEVSIQACNLGLDNYIIVGNDKDLLQIPGKHYNWVKGESFTITDMEAWDALWMQVLMGDRVDNIPGCWGMGFQKAKNRVVQWNAHKEFMIDIVHAEYEKSKKVKGCPYKDESEEDTYRRVHETYWLVKLKEYADEAPWYPKIKNKKKILVEVEVDGKTKASSDTSTSDCVPSATDSVGFKPITVQGQTSPESASGATV
jgi:5'-3' exonuclease